jgi:hypothetical protein
MPTTRDEIPPSQIVRRFRHLLRTERTFSGYRLTYKVYPITLTRPAVGVAKVPFTCPYCKGTMTLRVASQIKLRLYRLCWLVGLLASSIWLLIFFLTYADQDVTQGPGWITPLTVLSIIVGFCCLIGLILEDGIRLWSRRHGFDFWWKS